MNNARYTKKDKIKSYYKDTSKDGIYVSQPDRSEAMMAWKAEITIKEHSNKNEAP